MARMAAEVAATGHCSDPLLHAWLDEAYRRPGGKAAKQFARAVCNGCPIRDPCLAEAIENDEPGFWGGTGPYKRKLLRRNGRLSKEGTS